MDWSPAYPYRQRMTPYRDWSDSNLTQKRPLTALCLVTGIGTLLQLSAQASASDGILSARTRDATQACASEVSLVPLHALWPGGGQ